MNFDIMKFVLSDSSLNDYGFRLLTSGVRLERLRSNPVMLYMHDRYRIMPIGQWKNIQIEGDKITAEPEFDADDPVAQSVKQKVEKGVLRAASVAFDVIATSSDPSVLLPGQTRATVTEWEPYEASIVDIPGNRNALKLSHPNGLKLNSLEGENFFGILNRIVPKIETMNKLEKIAKALGLKSDATESEILQAIENIASKKHQSSSQEELVITLQAQVNDLKEQLAQQRAAALIDRAIGEGKISNEQRNPWLKLALANFEETKKAVEALSAPQNIADLLKSKRDKKREHPDRSKWSWEDYLQKDPQALHELQKDDPERFRELAENFYGRTLQW